MEKEQIYCAERAHVIAPAGEGGYVAVYEQATDSFRARYQKALAEKYELYSTDDFDGENDFCKNHFETYISDTETVHFRYHSYTGRLYVTYMPRREDMVLPPREAPYFERIGEDYPTMMTDLGTSHYHVMPANCQIIRVADGSFVIIDSAYGDHVEDLIYDMLCKQAPDPEHIVISAWIFTHAHWDHVGGFIPFAEKYHGAKNITLKQVVYNYPDESLVPLEIDRSRQRRTYEAAKRLNEKVELLKPHVGDVLYYADIKLRFLYTQEELLALQSNFPFYNATSCVFRLETEDGVCYLCGGDHGVFGSENGHSLLGEGAIYRWYGRRTESDIVLTFHHGCGGGADTKVYGCIKPKLVIWNTAWAFLQQENIHLFPPNQYFYDPEQAKANGVEYFISEDHVREIHFSDGRFTVTDCGTTDEYLHKTEGN